MTSPAIEPSKRRTAPGPQILAVAFRERSLCTRSGTCVGICPEGAISLDEDYYPVLDAAACTECGKCGAICPGGSVEFERLSHQVFDAPDDGSFDGHVLNTFIGCAGDADLHEHGTGGGVITAIAADLLRRGEIDGCVVTRMRPEKPWMGEPFIARSGEELAVSQGSRYTVIPLNRTLREIRQTPGRYAMIGLPCHVHGIREAMRMEPLLAERIVALLGIFCGGALEPAVVPELLRTKGIPLEDITDFEFRGGEWPGQMRAIFRDQPPRPVHYSNYKDGAYNYLIGIYLPQRCQVCFDGSNLFADISVGDAWTRGEDGQYKFRSQSRVLVRSRRGQELVRRAIGSGALVLEDVSADPSYRTHKMRSKRK
ncbi:MAG: Coenzyme F420 hydrogenase/dehydrogenase, beta subunit C-terminal domain, partial [Pseudomonadota bacterium]|nr:Coenzyme F420 hydrogenase/dehydrogenase, beta subunit C-terminal domain [Pseudomonadota bacterium]